MRRVFIAIFFLLFVLRLEAALPLTAKDISLMLRSGYSTAGVMRELSQRHFLDTMDPAKEEMLVKAGASAELIAALNDGTYALSPEQSAAAQQKIVDQEKRRSVEAQYAAKFDSQYQNQVLRERAAKSGPPIKNVVYEAVKGDLVRVQNGAVTHVDDEALANKKLIALYFSAHWCGPCRKFTPQLIDYYNRVAPQQPEFEIVFVSFDRSADAMQNYMREAKMPWLAIDYQKLETKEAIRKYAGKGIPCLVLIDAMGRVVSDSYDGEKYLGPGKVMADLDTIFTAVAAKKVAGRP